MLSNTDLTLRILKSARKLIETPDRWVQGALCVPRWDGWERYCLEGAIDEAARSLRGNVGIAAATCRADLKVRHAVQKRAGRPMAPCSYNDSPFTTHKDVLAVLDGAIEIAQKEGDSVEP
jgi:hypothetical protein